jgi:lipopolysaccharide assembly outer membrane protein LptD (OstA)
LLKTDKMGTKLTTMLTRLLQYAVLVILLTASSLYASEPVELVIADSSYFRIFDDSTMTYLFGKTHQVHLKQGKSDIKADSVFFSSEGNYWFMGSVRFADSLRTIYTNLLVYEQSKDIFTAVGQNRLIDLGDMIYLTGDSVTYDNRSNALMVTGGPYLAFNYGDELRMIEVRSDSLKYYSNEKYAEAFSNVEITKGSLLANCGRALLVPESNQLTLTENPLAYQRDNTVQGDSMAIYLVDDLLDHIDVVENAQAVYRQESTKADSAVIESTLKAKKITFLFVDEELQTIQSAGNSYSEYIPAANDSISSGRNIASGDSIKLHFDKRKLTEVEIITSCEGKFFSSVQTDSTGNIIDEDTISYKADRLKYFIGKSDINLFGSGQVKHEQVTLEADTILYNTNTKIMRARSFWSYGVEGDSVFHPVILKDAKDVIHGERMSYNVDTQRGKIKEADTELENAYYHGNIIRKQDEDVLFVDGGRYTTCELHDPHFHFYSSNMKLITDDRVVARPITLYIDRIPIFYLPYFVFSIKKDRHSGFLPFQIGNLERGSRFVNRLGYYWALSEYYDLETSINYNDAVGVTFNAGVRYKLRYKFNGSVRGSYARDISHTFDGPVKRNRWKLDLSHRHTLSETASLNGSGNFVSDASYVTDISTNLDERLNRSLRSTLSFSKRWGRISFNAVVKGTRELDNDRTTYNLPDLSFSMPSRQIFTSEKDEDKRWYQNLYLSYNTKSTNFVSNSLASDSSETRKHYSSVKHSMSLSMPLTVMTYLTLSPSATIQENWFYIFDTDQSFDKDLMSETGLRRGAYTFSLSTSTKIYGLFRPPIRSMVGLRHVVTPSMSFSYRPKSDRHQEEASFAGIGSGGSESQSVNLSLGNLFQIKYKSGDTEKKLDLFTLNFTTSYNFKSTSFKWSRLRTTMRSSTIPHLTFTLTASHDLYNQESGKLDIVGAHLTNLSVQTNFSLNGQITLPGSQLSGTDSKNPSDQKAGKYPWRVSIGHRYTESRSTSGSSITHWLTTSSNFNLTPNWKVSFSQNYDIKGKELTERRFEFYRDLHCWEAAFVWIPNGSRKGYYFRISVKQLPDIKFEKSESGIRGAFLDNF